MTVGLEVRQLRAVLFPERKQYNFHRIHTEYLVLLRAIKRSGIRELIDSGLQGNLQGTRNGQDVLQSLRPQLDGQVTLLMLQNQRLQQEHNSLRDQLARKSREGFSAYRAEVGLDFASRQLNQALTLPEDEARERFITAEHILKDALRVNHRNYHAHFGLGWSYLFLVDQPERAEFHLGCAVRIAREERNLPLAVFSMRHLADVRYSLGKFEAAALLGREMVSLNDTDDEEPLYEFIRYMAAAGEVEEATRKLSELVSRSPVYFLQAQAEPDFIRHKSINTMLQTISQVRVERIQDYVRSTWQANHFARLPLPDGIDPDALVQQTFQKHIKVMSHLPHGILSQQEHQIGDLIVRDSEKRIMQEMRVRSQQYEQVNEHKRRRWSWINRTGGVMVHSAVILFLACLMYFLARYLVGTLNMGLWIGNVSIVNNLLMLTPILLVVGVILLQFAPIGSRNLLRKQAALDNALKILSNG